MNIVYLEKDFSYRPLLKGRGKTIILVASQLCIHQKISLPRLKRNSVELIIKQKLGSYYPYDTSQIVYDYKARCGKKSSEVDLCIIHKNLFQAIKQNWPKNRIFLLPLVLSSTSYKGKEEVFCKLPYQRIKKLLSVCIPSFTETNRLYRRVVYALICVFLILSCMLFLERLKNSLEKSYNLLQPLYSNIQEQHTILEKLYDVQSELVQYENKIHLLESTKKVCIYSIFSNLYRLVPEIIIYDFSLNNREFHIYFTAENVLSVYKILEGHSEFSDLAMSKIDILNNGRQSGVLKGVLR